METNLTSIHADTGSIPGLALSGLRIQHCRELWCRSQVRLGSHVAVAGGYSSNSTPGPETSICHRYSPLKKKKKKRTEVHEKEDVAFLTSKIMDPLRSMTARLDGASLWERGGWV